MIHSEIPQPWSWPRLHFGRFPGAPPRIPPLGGHPRRWRLRRWRRWRRWELGMMGTSASSCGPEVERSRVTGNSCHAIIYTSNDIRYPLVNVYKKLWKDPPCYSWVNQRFQWQFSIAMCCCHDLIINFPRFTKFMALSEKMRTPKWRAFSAFSWIFTTKDQKWGWVKTLYPWWTSK